MDLKFVTVETFVIQFIILLFVLWVLNKFLFKPYLAYLDKWEDNQKKLEEDYKNIDKLVKEAEDKKEAILADARSKSEAILTDAEDLAKQKRESIIEKAENEAKSIVESWKNEIEKEKLAMLNGVKTKLTGLILKFNKKLFWEEKLNKEFVEKELSSIK